jgi:hypothetical protein
MRNLLLVLALGNLLLLAWQFWVAPAPLPPVPASADGIELFPSAAVPGPRQAPSQLSGTGAAAAQPTGSSCLFIGPLPDVVAAQQAAARLVAQGLDTAVIGRDTQVWLGHWVQIVGFASVPAAEAARQRLAAGGIADAYLMQDGAQPMVSLGVFRERSRADRIAAAARGLGFVVTLRDRYRPAVEQWLLIRPGPGQDPGPSALRLADDRNILRVEPASCDGEGSNLAPAN